MKHRGWALAGSNAVRASPFHAASGAYGDIGSRLRYFFPLPHFSYDPVAKASQPRRGSRPGLTPTAAGSRSALTKSRRDRRTERSLTNPLRRLGIWRAVHRFLNLYIANDSGPGRSARSRRGRRMSLSQGLFRVGIVEQDTSR